MTQTQPARSSPARYLLVDIAAGLLSTFAAFTPFLIRQPLLSAVVWFTVWSSVALVLVPPLSARLVEHFELGWRYGWTAAYVRRPAWVVVVLAGGGLLARDVARGAGWSLLFLAFLVGALVAAVVWANGGRSR